MAMNSHWRKWVKLNLERGCSRDEIYSILVNHRFSDAEIRREMGNDYPAHSSYQKMDDAWRGWIKENIERGCDGETIMKVLNENRFDPAEIEQELGAHLIRKRIVYQSPTIYKSLANVRLTRTAQAIDTGGKVQLYQLDDFMTPEECQKLIDITSERLRPSTVYEQEKHVGFRTSSTCDLVFIDDEFVKMIGDRIAETLGINSAYSEPIQVQRYEVGQQFKAHRDYFEHGTKAYEVNAYAMGDRTWTFMVYLNETAKGGGTHFPNLGKTFYPKTGRAIVWNNHYPDGRPNPDTIHAGEPVEEGYKVIITDWFRELPTVKMILD